jgi:hypothetical protein
MLPVVKRGSLSVQSTCINRRIRFAFAGLSYLAVYMICLDVVENVVGVLQHIQASSHDESEAQRAYIADSDCDGGWFCGATLPS